MRANFIVPELSGFMGYT